MKALSARRAPSLFFIAAPLHLVRFGGIGVQLFLGEIKLPKLRESLKGESGKTTSAPLA